MAEEVILADQDSLHRWDGPRSAPVERIDDHLDLDALNNRAASRCRSARSAPPSSRGCSSSSRSYLLPDGSTAASAFAPKNGGMPSGAGWVTAIERASGR